MILTSSNSNNPNLQLIPNNENLRDDTHKPDGNEARELDKEIHLHEDEQPEEDDDAGGVLVHDVPYDEGEDHGESGAGYAPEETEHGLSGGHGHSCGVSVFVYWGCAKRGGYRSPRFGVSIRF